MQILRWQNQQQHDEGTAAAADQAAPAGTQQRSNAKKRGSTARGKKQKQQKVAQQQDAGAASTSGPVSSSSSSKQPQLVLTLEDADQQPAALAVLQALYGVKPLPELLSELTQEQQLQAALLSDMWQVPDVGTAAANVLVGTADGQLSEAVTQSLMSMQAWPECLHVVAKKVLLSLLGNLEAVWADEALQTQLLGLPLHAMELLLSCDELKVSFRLHYLCFAIGNRGSTLFQHEGQGNCARVLQFLQGHCFGWLLCRPRLMTTCHTAQKCWPGTICCVWIGFAQLSSAGICLSLGGRWAVCECCCLLTRSRHCLLLRLQQVASEDTVLYTVRRYVEQDWDSPALQQLRPLVRCQHLSLYWLAALASSRNEDLEPFSDLLRELSTLLTIRITMPDFQVTAQELQRHFVNPPTSWALPRRALHPVSSVQLTWQLPVSELLAAVHCSIRDNAIRAVQSARSTPPLSGIEFVIRLHCVPENGSCHAGLFALPLSLPADLCASFKFRLHIPGTQLDMCLPTPQLNSRKHFWGWTDFFGTSTMPGGWDEAAWKAQGLPMSGTLPITLTVNELSQHHRAPRNIPEPWAQTMRVVPRRGGRGRGR
jgi:hypothetical protein